MRQRPEGIGALVRDGSDQAGGRVPAEDAERHGGGHQHFHDQRGGARSMELTMGGQCDIRYGSERHGEDGDDKPAHEGSDGEWKASNRRCQSSDPRSTSESGASSDRPFRARFSLRAGQRGRVKRNALPPPSAGSTQMRPPWASTTRRQTARPIPTPSVSLSARENMPKIRPAWSCSTPGPLSRTVTTHSRLSRSADTSTRGGASPRNFSAFAMRF